MPLYRLTFRGKGFAAACDPTGRQIIDGFCASLMQSGDSKECAIATARDELLRNSQVRHLIDETHMISQEEGTWTIECEEARKVLFGWFRPRQSVPKIDVHWTPPHDIDLTNISFEVEHLNCTANHFIEALSTDSDDSARE